MLCTLSDDMKKVAERFGSVALPVVDYITRIRGAPEPEAPRPKLWCAKQCAHDDGQVTCLVYFGCPYADPEERLRDAHRCKEYEPKED